MIANILKIILTLSIFTLAAFFALTLSFFDGVAYTEKDKITYYLITPSVIAKVPKISDNYTFTYTGDDNYGYEINAIHFRSIQDVEQKRKIIAEYIERQRAGLDSNKELVVNFNQQDKSELSIRLFSYTRPH